MVWTGLTNFTGAFNYAIFGEGWLGLFHRFEIDLTSHVWWNPSFTFTFRTEEAILVIIRPGDICRFQSGGARAYFQAAASAAQRKQKKCRI